MQTPLQPYRHSVSGYPFFIAAPYTRFDKRARIGYTRASLQTGERMHAHRLPKKGAKKPDPVSG
jgi:hypothetical protein